MPISKNKIVHTGANIQFGGDNADLFIESNHVLTFGAVNNEPRIPAAWHIRIDIINFKGLLSTIFYFLE